MTLQAGAAVRDISPRGPMALFGYPHVERISEGVHDPLLASALYLRTPSAAVVLVSLDILFVDPPRARLLRRAIAERTGTPEDCVFVHTTHTHSGPVTSRILAWRDDATTRPPDPDYLDFLEHQAVEAATDAMANARGAELAWTTADATGVGGSRLAADGVTDPEAGILAVREAGGGPMLAVLLNYGMHPTVLHEDSRLVSSDFPHYAREHLHERIGENLRVIYQTAPAGDQSPRYLVTGQTFAEAERLGRKLGEAAAASLARLADSAFSRQPMLSGELREVNLPRRTMPPVVDAERQLAAYRAEYERLRAEGAERPLVRTAECAIFGAEGTVALARAQSEGEIDRIVESYRPIALQVLRIGEAWLAGLPGEVFAEYALRIKRQSPAKTFVASLVGGELQGYIVTPQAAAAGGYEATTSLFAPEAGGVMVGEVLAILRRK
jgi:neutral ceramidase